MHANPGLPEAAEILDLPAVLDIRAAKPLADQFLSLRGRDVTVNAASVQRVGGQCLQVLLAARATWAADGGRFRVTAASPAFTEGLALLGAAALASHDDAPSDQE